MEEYGTKELYDISIKSTYPMRIGNREFDKGETIFKFSSIMMSTIAANRNTVPLTGGRYNAELMYWSKTNNITFSFEQGTVSKIGLALLNNYDFVESVANTQVIDYSQTIATGEELKYTPIVDDTLFVYRNGVKLNRVPTLIEVGENDYYIEGKEIYTSDELTNLDINYTFFYDDNSNTIEIGQNLFNGYLSLSGKMRFRENENSNEVTAIFEIPRFRFASNLTMRLGRGITPYVYPFRIEGVREEYNEDCQVAKLTILSTDIDSDL